jgi:hypothetical protein
MKILLRSLFFTALLATFSCQENQTSTNNEQIDLAKVPDSWVKDRVQKAENRLQKSDAGKIVWQAMEAHGGLTNWYKSGPVSFHFNYQPLDGSTPRNTYQVVDTWNSKARHQSATDKTAEFGWNGEKLWVTDTSAFAYNTRFWAMTPYFFMGQPFALDGEGVNLEMLPQKEHKNQTQDVVKVTFDAGTGDAPDDYYILYFNTDSHQLSVIRYIVSYPGYFPKGKHTPEKFMELIGKQNVNGIVLPKGYKTYMLAENELPGKHVTNITLSEVEFLPETKAAYFEKPDKAMVMDGLK